MDTKEVKIASDGGTNIHSFYNSSLPGFVILLIDQTLCDDKDPNTFNARTNAVNSFILNLIFSNIGAEGIIKDRCYLSLISYSEDFFILKEGWLSYFADNPIKIEKIKKKVSDVESGMSEIDEEIPIWIENLREGNYPTNIKLLVNQIENWHSNKGSNYPESIVVHFCSQNEGSFRDLVKSISFCNANFKKPIIIENIV